MKVFMLPIYLIISYSTSAAGKLQYCHDVEPQSPISFCLAVNTCYNTSTSLTDLIITFGYGTLMFVMYAERSSTDGERHSLSVSSILKLVDLRKTAVQLKLIHIRGHYEPRPSMALPEVEELNLSLRETGWLEASFFCYGCDRKATI